MGKWAAYVKRYDTVFAFLTMEILSLVSFGLGGTSFGAVFRMAGFLIALMAIPFLLHGTSASDRKAFLLFSIPLIAVALFAGFNRFWISLTGATGLANDLLMTLGVLAFYFLGHAARHNKILKLDWILLSIGGALGLLVLISAIYGIARYGFFYAEIYKGGAYYYDGALFVVSDEMKMLVGFRFEEVSLAYGGVYGFLLASSLFGLLFVSPKEDLKKFLAILGLGLLGLASLVLIPNIDALLLLIPVGLFAVVYRLLIHKEKVSLGLKAVFFSLLGLASVFLLIAVVNAADGRNLFADIPLLNKLFNNGRVMNSVNIIINAVFKSGSTSSLDFAAIFGGTSFTLSGAGYVSEISNWEGHLVSVISSGNKAFEFEYMMESGFIAFLALCVFLVFTIMSVRKFLVKNDSPLSSRFLVASTLLAYLIYASFQSDHFPLIHESGTYIGVMQSPLLLAAFFLCGYAYEPIFKVKEDKSEFVAVEVEDHEAK